MSNPLSAATSDVVFAASPAAGAEVPPPWTCPAPADLPAFRGEVASWMVEAGADFYYAMTLLGDQPQRPPGPPALAARRLAVEERGRVCGELFWVSAAMTQLARHAGPQLAKSELYPHDLPSRSGFMVFEEPLATYRTREDRLVNIVAVSWGPWEGPGGWGAQGGIWLTFYSDPVGILDAGTPEAWRVARQQLNLAPVMPDNEAGWPFGALDETPVFPADSTARWAQLVCAAWLLMRQPLTAESVERAERAARRRLAKADLPAGPVRIVHVRRRERAGQATPEASAGRQYRCQWWVGGHWRRYHCGPGGERVERRWIDEYLAGPEDKPITGVERVQVWDR